MHPTTKNILLTLAEYYYKQYASARRARYVPKTHLIQVSMLGGKQKAYGDAYSQIRARHPALNLATLTARFAREETEKE